MQKLRVRAVGLQVDDPTFAQIYRVVGNTVCCFELVLCGNLSLGVVLYLQSDFAVLCKFWWVAVALVVRRPPRLSFEAEPSTYMGHHPRHHIRFPWPARVSLQAYGTVAVCGDWTGLSTVVGVK